MSRVLNDIALCYFTSFNNNSEFSVNVYKNGSLSWSKGSQTKRNTVKLTIKYNTDATACNKINIYNYNIFYLIVQ